LKTEFWKYQGTGNDFVMINNYKSEIVHSAELARKLCDRHFGIGSDGLIILEQSSEVDFKMVFYNPDGSQSFCGNGSRCAVRFAHEQGIIAQNQTKFLSTDGIHTAEIDDSQVNLQMNAPVFLPLNFNEAISNATNLILINTGSPHLMVFLSDLDLLKTMDIKAMGAKIRYSEEFKKEGVNINFVAISGQNEIYIRTYERGVEDETLSCGTGVTASAIAYHHLFNQKAGFNQIKVNAVGGKLAVTFEFEADSYTNMHLCGPAESVFNGLINI
jgi:diaminopimelate epimerase